MSAGFKPLRTVDFAEIGFGDNLMAWAGLYALFADGYRPTAADCKLCVPTELAGLATRVFSKYAIRVEGVEAGARRLRTRPLFTSSPPDSLWDGCKTYFGSDWRMNGFEALDRQKTIPLPGARPRARDRVRLFLSEHILYGRRNWRAATPEYFGYRLWRPLASDLGVLPVPFLTLVKRSLATLRAEATRYVESLSPQSDERLEYAVFPTGKAFQAFPPAACKHLQERLPKGQTTFFIPSSDPWFSGYREAGLNLRELPGVDDLFRIVKTAKRLLTADSFASHAAQIVRDDFVVALTRDIRENVIHPGAHPRILANHPPCAPCSYVTRGTSPVCSAQHSNCLAFDDAVYLDHVANALLSQSSA